MTLNCPSPLSNSALLTVQAPHRFCDHVDAVILTDRTLLMGAGTDCHIVTPVFPDRAVLVNRDGKWQGKIDSGGDFIKISPGIRVSLGSFAMTLEEA